MMRHGTSVNPNREEYRDADFLIKSAAGACKWQFVLSNRVIGRVSEQFWGSLNAVTDEIIVESCRDRRLRRGLGGRSPTWRGRTRSWRAAMWQRLKRFGLRESYDRFWSKLGNLAISLAAQH